MFRARRVSGWTGQAHARGCARVRLRPAASPNPAEGIALRANPGTGPFRPGSEAKTGEDMTAEQKGQRGPEQRGPEHHGPEFPVAGLLAALKRLREHWVLVVALASALFWARDLVETHAALPGEVARQLETVESLAVRTAWIETVIAVWPGFDGGEAASLPGTRFGLAALAPGAKAVVRWPGGGRPSACALRSVSGVMVDASGQWFPVAAEPAEAAGSGLAVTLRAHRQMGPGSARLKLRLTRDCGDRLQVDISPWLIFTATAGPR